MHVSVQKFTTTTWSRSSAGPSGSELSHPVAARSEGMCTWAITTAASRLDDSPRARELPGPDAGTGRHHVPKRGPSDQGPTGDSRGATDQWRREAPAKSKPTDGGQHEQHPRRHRHFDGYGGGLDDSHGA